jgi:lipoyl(octanoyl) transferase
MRDLEAVMIQTCASYGLRASAVEGLTGAWIQDRKVGAIGVRISRWVTMHGLALNVSTDLSHFQSIIPCGISDKSVTSLSQELGLEINMPEVEARLAAAFADVFDATMQWHEGPPSFFCPEP